MTAVSHREVFDGLGLMDRKTAFPFSILFFNQPALLWNRGVDYLLLAKRTFESMIWNSRVLFSISELSLYFHSSSSETIEHKGQRAAKRYGDKISTDFFFVLFRFVQCGSLFGNYLERRKDRFILQYGFDCGKQFVRVQIEPYLLSGNMIIVFLKIIVLRHKLLMRNTITMIFDLLRLPKSNISASCYKT